MKHLSFVLLFIIAQKWSFSQRGTLDSLFASRDTTAVMDSLMKDFDLFMDSLTAPKSFLNISIGAGNGFFSFENKNSVYLSTKRKIILSPGIGYFHKSGLGLSATAFMMNDNGGVNVYQFAFSPSYDLIRRSFPPVFLIRGMRIKIQWISTLRLYRMSSLLIFPTKNGGCALPSMLPMDGVVKPPMKKGNLPAMHGYCHSATGIIWSSKMKSLFVISP